MTNRLRRHLSMAYQIATSPIRRLPDFIVIGVVKGGTTSLLKYLDQHPSIMVSVKKEIHFFDEHFDKGLLWYRQHFPLQSWSNQPQILTGEASPAYFCQSSLAPARIHQVVPQVKLILLLRNPVDRAYSHYCHRYRRQAETETSFAKLALEEKSRLTEKLSDWSLQFDSQNNRPRLSCYHLASGLYIIHLQNWLEYFSPQQLLVLNSDDLFKQPRQVVHQVSQFLDLPDPPNLNFPIYNSGSYKELDTGLRQKLCQFFEPYNHQLYQLLDTDFGWH